MNKYKKYVRTTSGGLMPITKREERDQSAQQPTPHEPDRDTGKKTKTK